MWYGHCAAWHDERGGADVAALEGSGRFARADGAIGGNHVLGRRRRHHRAVTTLDVAATCLDHPRGGSE